MDQHGPTATLGPRSKQKTSANHSTLLDQLLFPSGYLN